MVQNEVGKEIANQIVTFLGEVAMERVEQEWSHQLREENNAWQGKGLICLPDSLCSSSVLQVYQNQSILGAVFR